MAFSPAETTHPLAVDASIGDSTLRVDLSDGRTIAIPLAWYPRLAHATPDERANWRLIADGEGIHWSDLDEDIAVSALLTGNRSAESHGSPQRWLKTRAG